MKAWRRLTRRARERFVTWLLRPSIRAGTISFHSKVNCMTAYRNGLVAACEDGRVWYVTFDGVDGELIARQIEFVYDDDQPDKSEARA